MTCTRKKIEREKKNDGEQEEGKEMMGDGRKNKVIESTKTKVRGCERKPEKKYYSVKTVGIWNIPAIRSELSARGFICSMYCCQ